MALVMVAYRWLLVWALRVLGLSAMVWIGVTTRWLHLTDPGEGDLQGLLTYVSLAVAILAGAEILALSIKRAQQ